MSAPAKQDDTLRAALLAYDNAARDHLRDCWLRDRPTGVTTRYEAFRRVENEPMVESKHTPGPWDAWQDGNGSFGFVYSDDATGSAIAQVAFEYVGRSKEEIRANACLIAAAPDLLAALVALIPADFDQHPEDFMPDWHAARAAIAKATGASLSNGKGERE